METPVTSYHPDLSIRLSVDPMSDKTGTTKEQIDKQRAQNQNTGGNGTKVGELGGNIDHLDF